MRGLPRQAEALDDVSRALREACPRVWSIDQATSHLTSAVVARFRAEREQSMAVRVGREFEDLHLVGPGWRPRPRLSCLHSCWSASGTSRLPSGADSLAGVLSALASPGSDRNPLTFDDRMVMPRVAPQTMVPSVSSGSGEEDLVFALAAVTQEGRIAHPEVLLRNGSTNETVTRLMNAVLEARFRPASIHGSPVAVNMVWVLSHTTVRAKALS